MDAKKVIDFKGVRLNAGAISAIEAIQSGEANSKPTRQIKEAISFIIKQYVELDENPKETLDVITGLHYAMEIIDDLDVKAGKEAAYA